MYAYLWTQNASLDILNNQSIFFLYYFLLKNHFTKVCKRKNKFKKKLERGRKAPASQAEWPNRYPLSSLLKAQHVQPSKP
jgi:hypothetical protein